MKVLDYYKKLCRRIQRLPFDRHTLKLLQSKIKDEFVHADPRIQRYSYTTIDIKKYRRIRESLDEFLVNENYNALAGILDLAYKEELPWVRVLLRQNYLSLKKHWPQRHLVHVFASDKSIQEYDRSLKPVSMKDDLSFLPRPQIKPKYLQDRIRPIRSQPQPDKESRDIQDIIERARTLHTFVDRHRSVLSRHAVKPFEVIYEPTKLGKPGGAIQAHKEYKGTISWVRKFVQMFTPISKPDLSHLIGMATYVAPPASSEQPMNEAYRINPNFFRYLAKKHTSEMQSASTQVRAYLRKKPLVPNDSTIRGLLREYARQQFYLDSETGQYRLSWLQSTTERQAPPEMLRQYQDTIKWQREHEPRTQQTQRRKKAL